MSKSEANDYAIYMARCYSTEQKEFLKALFYFLVKAPTRVKLTVVQAG